MITPLMGDLKEEGQHIGVGKKGSKRLRGKHWEQRETLGNRGKQKGIMGERFNLD